MAQQGTHPKVGHRRPVPLLRRAAEQGGAGLPVDRGGWVPMHQKPAHLEFCHRIPRPCGHAQSVNGGGVAGGGAAELVLL